MKVPSSCLLSFHHWWPPLWCAPPQHSCHQWWPLEMTSSLKAASLPKLAPTLFYPGNRSSVYLDRNCPVKTQAVCPVCYMGVPHGVLQVLSKYRQTIFPESSSSPLLFTLSGNLITGMTPLQERVCGDCLLLSLVLWGFEIIPENSFHSASRELTTPSLGGHCLLFVKMNSFCSLDAWGDGIFNIYIYIMYAVCMECWYMWTSEGNL